MAKKFKSQIKNRPTKSSHELAEFGKGKRGLILCPECRAAYYKKSWHHSVLNLDAKENTLVTFKLCPADQMIKNKQYEGKLVVKNLPKEIEQEIYNLIRNVSKLAYSKDPLHKLISATKQGKDLVAFTTENELAVSMAKKIKSAHAKSKSIKISYAPEPSDVSLAIVEF